MAADTTNGNVVQTAQMGQKSTRTEAVKDDQLDYLSALVCSVYCNSMHTLPDWVKTSQDFKKWLDEKAEGMK